MTDKKKSPYPHFGDTLYGILPTENWLESRTVKVLTIENLRFRCDCPPGIEIGSYDNQVTLDTPQFMRDICSMGCLTFRDQTCVDACLADEIKDLWSRGIVTTGCCCGHNLTLPGGLPYIGVRDEDIPKMKDLGYVVVPNTTRPDDEDSFFPKSIHPTATGVEGLTKTEIRLINNVLEQYEDNCRLVKDRLESSSKPKEGEPTGVEALKTPEGRARIARIFTAPMLRRSIFSATDPDGTKVVFGVPFLSFIIEKPGK